MKPPQEFNSKIIGYEGKHSSILYILNINEIKILAIQSIEI